MTPIHLLVLLDKRIIVFKTSISTKEDLEMAAPYLNSHSQISDWSVDREDDDNVLRIVGSEVSEIDIIKTLKSLNIQCEKLV